MSEAALDTIWEVFGLVKRNWTAAEKDRNGRKHGDRVKFCWWNNRKTERNDFLFENKASILNELSCTWFQNVKWQAHECCMSYIVCNSEN